MRQTVSKKQFMKLTKKVSLVKTPVEVVMILMYTFIQVQVPIFVERNLPLLKVLKASPVDLDSSLPSQLTLVFMGAPPLLQTSKQLLCVQQS